MKHTPGPWSYAPPDDQVQDLFAEEYFFISGPGADVHGLMPVADAKLISAAPDLLEALTSLLDGPDGKTGSEYSAIIANGYAAIAKATGAQP